MKPASKLLPNFSSTSNMYQNIETTSTWNPIECYIGIVVAFFVKDVSLLPV